MFRQFFVFTKEIFPTNVEITDYKLKQHSTASVLSLSLLQVQWMGRELRHPGSRSGCVVYSAGITRQTQTLKRTSHHFFLPTFFLPCLSFPNCFFFLNMVFFLLSVLTSRPRIQSSRCTSHFSCLTPEGEKQKDIGDFFQNIWLNERILRYMISVSDHLYATVCGFTLVKGSGWHLATLIKLSNFQPVIRLCLSFGFALKYRKMFNTHWLCLC